MTAQATSPVDELDALAAAYGKCLWTWSEIEAQIFQIFAAASGLPAPGTAEEIERHAGLGTAFFAVNGVEIRIAMTDALARERWAASPNRLREWDGIFKRLNKARRKRGVLAHRTGGIFQNPRRGKPFVAITVPWHHIKYPATYAQAKQEGISLQALQEIHAEFNQLRLDLTTFSLKVTLSAHAARSDAAVTPPPLVLRIAATKEQA